MSALRSTNDQLGRGNENTREESAMPFEHAILTTSTATSTMGVEDDTIANDAETSSNVDTRTEEHSNQPLQHDVVEDNIDFDEKHNRYSYDHFPVNLYKIMSADSVDTSHELFLVADKK